MCDQSLPKNRTFDPFISDLRRFNLKIKKYYTLKMTDTTFNFHFQVEAYN